MNLSGRDEEGRTNNAIVLTACKERQSRFAMDTCSTLHHWADRRVFTNHTCRGDEMKTTSRVKFAIKVGRLGPALRFTSPQPPL